VEASFNQIRQHGRNDVSVIIRLLDTLLCLADQIREVNQVKAIKTQADALYSVCNENFIAKKDRDDIECLYQSMSEKLKKVRNN